MLFDYNYPPLDALKVGDTIAIQTERRPVREVKVAKVGRLYVTTECGYRFAIVDGRGMFASRAWRSLRDHERNVKREKLLRAIRNLGTASDVSDHHLAEAARALGVSA